MARRNRKKSTVRTILVLTVCGSFLADTARSAPVNIPGFYGRTILPPLPSTLPVVKPSAPMVGISSVDNLSPNRLVIRQNAANASVDYDSFNIGADSSVHFDQQGNANWKVLNRIHDVNPSLIFGQLTADGHVYLINQNGIFFGQGSKINTNSLIASAMNLSDSDFMDNLLKFKVDPELPFTPDAVVSNHGEIKAGNGGYVFLLGPHVENAGTIDVPLGQIGLAAATQLDIVSPDSEGLILDLKGGLGEAWNSGKISSDSGWIGMYGRVVNQDGLIRSVTAVKKNGNIELRATDRITTGENSVTESPIADSSEKVDGSFVFSGGKIRMGGLQTVLGDEDGIQSVSTGTPPAVVEHRGSIDAPSGEIIIDAVQRVFLETGSSINAGGAWSDDSASKNAIDATLNSVELRDAHSQKDGVLKGEAITANAITGSAIGDISGALLTGQQTALEKAINGGLVTITAEEIIAKKGSSVDISGGAVRYSKGFLDTTKLVSGSKIYDISNAPADLKYDGIMGSYERTHERFGVTDRYTGVFYGGAAPLKGAMTGYTKGGNAGTFTLNARQKVVFDGQLNASATKGFYQTKRTLNDEAARKLSEVRGTEAPEAGTLVINLYSGDGDSIITLARESSPLPDDFGLDTPLTGQQSVISADVLNRAGLGTLKLDADRKITIENGASVDLAAGGAFEARAGLIEHSGEIIARSGTISLLALGNGEEAESASKGVFLARGSRLDASGERIDNSAAGKISGAAIASGLVQGGSITLHDETAPGNGVFIQDGAVVDVSGGYQIDTKRKITGGNAGTLAVRGESIRLDGDLRGYALADSQGKIKGGELILHAGNVEIADGPASWPEDFASGTPVPEALKGSLAISGDHFADTGFTRIEVNSFNDVNIGPSVKISPSLVRLKTPMPAVLQRGNLPRSVTGITIEALPGREDLVRLNSDMSFQAGPSSFKAEAGRMFQWQDKNMIAANAAASLNVSGGAQVRMSPQGKIVLSSSGSLTMAGTLEAPAGEISLIAGKGGSSELIISEGGQILAKGYNRPDFKAALPGYAYNQTPVGAGLVTLSADGDILLESGSLVDISGSDPVKNRVLSAGKIATYTEAGAPGTLSISYSGSLTSDGGILAKKKLAGLKGGALTISSTDKMGTMEVTAGEIEKIIEAGFDDLTLKSARTLLFNGGMDETLGRKLTLDAPEISGAAQESIVLRAPWITLSNTADNIAGGQAAAGQAEFMLSSAGWLDVTGKINLSGFSEARLEAGRDMRLTDRYYSEANAWAGQLTTAGDLLLKADRVYPAVRSDYTVRSTSGKVSVLPGDVPVGGPIYSAGGSLTVEAHKGIEVSGILAAPMGTVTLKGTGPGSRIYLGDGSEISSAGSADVRLGEINDDGEWIIKDKLTHAYVPMEISAGSVMIDAPEVITRDGADIDISGGGSVFSYLFQPGVEGSVDPLTRGGRFVVMTDRSIQLPGDSVYLEGGGGLSAGEYSILPAEFAFLPGAVILEEQSVSIAAGQKLSSRDGLPVIAGFTTVSGTGIRGAKPKAYSVMKATEALKQGNFATTTLTMGDGGTLTVKGDTAILNASIRSAALKGYLGGKMNLSARDIIVRPEVARLPADFSFDTALDSTPQIQEFIGKLSVAANILKGLQEIRLGSDGLTETVTVMEGAKFEAPVISLTAAKTITIETGSELHGVAASGIGEISLNSLTGTALVREGSLLHASHAIIFNTIEQDIQGEILHDNSSLRLSGEKIYFVPEGYTRTGPGTFISKSTWDRYSSFEDIQLVSGSDVLFMDDFALSTAGSIFIDAARIASGKDMAVVSVSAPLIGLTNSGTAAAAQLTGNGSHIAFNAGNITVGSGELLFDGFTRVDLNASENLTLTGVGALRTGSADLFMKAARVGAAADTSAGRYVAANFIVDAGVNALSISRSGSETGASTVPGGTLEFSARTMDLSGVVEASGATVKFTASGDGQGGGIFLRDGGKVLSRGTDSAPGGKVTMDAGNGSLVLEDGSLIDVSAGEQGGAGAISLNAREGGVTLGGELRGMAQGGSGGSFAIDSKELSDSDIAWIADNLASGGFTESIDLRARTGDVLIAEGKALNARRVRLSADDRQSGRIEVSGEINAAGGADSGVELYSMNNLDINSGGRVSSDGGSVLMSSSEGWVNVNAGATVDVAGAGEVRGALWLRAQRDGDIKLNTDGTVSGTSGEIKVKINGTVSGASDVYAEAVKAYSETYSVEALSNWLKEAEFYYNANTAIDRLNGSTGGASFHLLPGIEVVNSGDINIDADLDLTNYRFGADAGVLTLRAGGNLNVKANIVDHPTSYTQLPGPAGMNSWGINLVAGADGAADYMRTVRGTGNLAIDSSKLVYTESAPIRFASGNDTFIGAGAKPSYMIYSEFGYNLASYSGDIQGSVGRDLVITGGAIQTATGDISVVAGRDLLLKKASDRLASIRTTGHNPSSMNSYWQYSGGGDITIEAGRTLAGHNGEKYVTASNDRAWDTVYSFGSPREYALGANYKKTGSNTAAIFPTEGLVTMGGGSLKVSTGSDFMTQAGTFGAGDLVIHSGGDIKGRFMNKQGLVEIRAMGNLGANDYSITEQVIEAHDSRIKASALGFIGLGAVLNPTAVHKDSVKQQWKLTYTAETSLSLKAGGDVTIEGTSAYATSTNSRILPAAVDVEAGGDILLNNQFALAPSATGALRFIAGSDIKGHGIFMSDLDPARVYGVRYTNITGSYPDLFSTNPQHDTVLDGSGVEYIPLHGEDGEAIEIKAGRDIYGLSLYLPKKVDISAGRDIRDIYYFGQNLNASDASKVRAGRDISFGYGATGTLGFIQAGPGALIVQAGGSIELGNSEGVQSKGNEYNPALDSKGSSVLVAAGYSEDLTVEDAGTFFGGLRSVIKESASYEGQDSGSRDLVNSLGQHSGAGDINMTRSQISTNYGASDIFIIASGKLNVGKSTFSQDEQSVQKTGILTSEGGGINIFAVGNIDVNESRVMTFFGGDITVWSDSGDINAGRGSKTQVNAEAHTDVFDKVLDRWVKKFVPPSVGSGIRAVTYDPDGLVGTLKAPLEGDSYLHAKMIDAGEAGVSGRNIFIGAQQVANAVNISSTIGSVSGMPASASGATGLGSLSGAGSAAAGTAELSQNAVSMASSQASASQMVEDIIAKWLDVKVIEFVQDE